MGKSIIIILLLFMFYNTNCNDNNCKTPLTDRNGCEECNEDYYLNYNELYCEECKESDGKILISQFSYYYQKNVQKCYTKVENCEEYSEKDDFCQLCKDGFKRNLYLIMMNTLKT